MEQKDVNDELEYLHRREVLLPLRPTGYMHNEMIPVR